MFLRTEQVRYLHVKNLTSKLILLLLRSAHSRFNKYVFPFSVLPSTSQRFLTPHLPYHRLYKIVFPGGVDNYATPATSKAPSPSPSIRSDTSSTHTTKPTPSRGGSGFFGSIGRLGGSFLSPGGASPTANPVASTPDGPVEELIMSGTAFGEFVYLGVSL